MQQDSLSIQRAGFDELKVQTLKTGRKRHARAKQHGLDRQKELIHKPLA